MLFGPQPANPPPPASSPFVRWYVRIPLKWLVFLAVTFLVLYPSPSRFAKHVGHLRNLDAMVEPKAPELAAWDEELLQRLAKGTAAKAPTTQPFRELLRSLPPQQVQASVEAFVYEKVKYAWDWETWGVADYMPTVAEMFAEAAKTGGAPLREDCDGRAVMAASLMRRLGYDSHIVTDVRHVWVTTPQGEWMGPGRAKTMVSTPQGNKIAFRTASENVAVSLSYGIAVFPLGRELLILLAAYALSLCRRMSRGAAAFGGLLLLQGLLFVRCGILAPKGAPDFTASWPAWAGIMHWAAAFFVLWRAAYRTRQTIARHPQNKA